MWLSRILHHNWVSQLAKLSLGYAWYKLACIKFHSTIYEGKSVYMCSQWPHSDVGWKACCHREGWGAMNYSDWDNSTQFLLKAIHVAIHDHLSCTRARWHVSRSVKNGKSLSGKFKPCIPSHLHTPACWTVGSRKLQTSEILMCYLDLQNVAVVTIQGSTLLSIALTSDSSSLCVPADWLTGPDAHCYLGTSSKKCQHPWYRYRGGSQHTPTFATHSYHSGETAIQ